MENSKTKTIKKTKNPIKPRGVSRANSPQMKCKWPKTLKKEKKSSASLTIREM